MTTKKQIRHHRHIADQRCHRRFDEAARLRDRGDGLIQHSPTDKLTLSAFGGTLQDNFNRLEGPMINTASPAPGSASPFYPYFVVGDPSSAHYLFLGTDQPSYHAHTLIATLEYRF